MRVRSASSSTERTRGRAARPGRAASRNRPRSSSASTRSGASRASSSLPMAVAADVANGASPARWAATIRATTSCSVIATTAVDRRPTVPVPPRRPGVPYSGSPARRSAARSRSMVRRVTPSSSARRRAEMVPGRGAAEVLADGVEPLDPAHRRQLVRNSDTTLSHDGSMLTSWHTNDAPLLGLRTVIYPAPDLDAAKATFTAVLGVAPYFDEPFYVGFDGRRLRARPRPVDRSGRRPDHLLGHERHRVGVRPDRRRRRRGARAGARGRRGDQGRHRRAAGRVPLRPDREPALRRRRAPDRRGGPRP